MILSTYLRQVLDAPDIVRVLASAVGCWGPKHDRAVARVFRYIKGTLAPGSTADLITCNLTGYRPADICNGIFWCMEGQSGTGTLVIGMRAKTMTTNMQYLVQGGLGDGARPKGGGALSSVMHKQ